MNRGEAVAAAERAAATVVAVSFAALEVDDVLDGLDGLDELRELEMELVELLVEEDVVHLAAAMEPGSIAAVLVWENTWATPFAAAARRAGGQLVGSGRIPIQAIIASIEADETD